MNARAGKLSVSVDGGTNIILYSSSVSIRRWIYFSFSSNIYNANSSCGILVAMLECSLHMSFL